MTPSQVNDRIFGSRGDQDRTSETVFIKLQGCIHKTGDEGKHDKTRRYSSTLEADNVAAFGLWPLAFGLQPNAFSLMVFGLWRVCFPPCVVRPGRRVPVQGLSEGSRGFRDRLYPLPPHSLHAHFVLDVLTRVTGSPIGVPSLASQSPC